MLLTTLHITSWPRLRQPVAPTRPERRRWPKNEDQRHTDMCTPDLFSPADARARFGDLLENIGGLITEEFAIASKPRRVGRAIRSR
ncbi:hypothetical protein ACRAWD_22505 [Caulobacter segnis]